MPVKELHAVVPQVQSMELREVRLTFVQVLPLEQVLVEESQKRPDFAVHRLPPHKQGAGFDVTPLVCVQPGAVIHRQSTALL
jgi:hypothetical protein